MRFVISSVLFALVACGGAPQKPAASEGVDTSSLESGGSAASPASSSASSAASAPSSPSASTSSLDTGSASAAATPAGSSASNSAAPASNHPVPGATGDIDGKPFSPKLAQVAGPMQKDGRLPIVLHEGSDCITPSDSAPGSATMRLLVTWQDGYKVDLGSLKGAKKNDPGEASFTRTGDDKKAHLSTTFRPAGRLTVVSAPTAQNALGKIKIDLSSGGYILAGDLDVKVCTAPK